MIPSAPALLLLALTSSAPQKQGEALEVERVVVAREALGPLYMWISPRGVRPEAPLLVLLHESRSSSAEYRPIQPRLHELGYATLAVDLSSGLACREIKNVTARKASELGRSPTYLDVLRDLHDAVLWARQDPLRGKVVLVGSGYSAALALVFAAEHPDLVDGVAAFSPGEVFTPLGKPADWVQTSAQSWEGPVWITSARAEEKDWQPIFAALTSTHKASFLPAGAGLHGARALWPENEGSAEYRQAFEAFLGRHFPVVHTTPTTPPSGG